VHLREILPPETDALAMEPEELAGYLLKLFDGGRPRELHRHNFFGDPELKDLYSEEARKALMEAWMWLEHELMIAPRVDLISGEGMFITRRGKRLLQDDVGVYESHSRLLPRELLHPRIDKEAWTDFARERYDVAIFVAFREIETEVRRLGGFDARMIGTDLIRKAFAPGEGPLAFADLPKAEQEATAHLFAGAIGTYKNPPSHRPVAHTPPQAAAILVFASHLLSTLDTIALTKALPSA
jgi:uncharacterized protein (TIGR02391 family)